MENFGRPFLISHFPRSRDRRSDVATLRFGHVRLRIDHQLAVRDLNDVVEQYVRCIHV
jgi:hypothetical protein